VQDDRVRVAVINFADCMNRACDDSLDSLSLKLSAACRQSIADGWGVTLSKNAVTKEELERARK
jgi:hypothetical protein